LSSDVIFPNLCSITLSSQLSLERWTNFMAMVLGHPSIKVLRLTANLMTGFKSDVENLRKVLLVEERKVDTPRMGITGVLDCDSIEFEEDLLWME